MMFGLCWLCLALWAVAGCLYAFELGKLLNRLSIAMQMPLGPVIIYAQNQGAGCPRHHVLSRRTSG